MKTYGRLRSKLGGAIEDVDLPPFTVPIGFDGWHFISEFKNKVPDSIIKRFRSLYIPPKTCTVHDRKSCYCYEL